MIIDYTKGMEAQHIITEDYQDYKQRKLDEANAKFSRAFGIIFIIVMLFLVLAKHWNIF